MRTQDLYRLRKGFEQISETDPDGEYFFHLKYAPFDVDIGEYMHARSTLHINGLIGGKQVISKSYSGEGTHQQFAVQAGLSTIATGVTNAGTEILPIESQ